MHKSLNELENHSFDEEWVSITEAARRLTAEGDTVSQSTLSRYLVQHAEALVVKEDGGRAKQVDLVALRQHRAENIRLLRSRPAVSDDRPALARFVGTQTDGAARKVLAEAEMRELDLAVRRGDLTPTAEVARAGHEAVAAMTAEFERALDVEASRFATRHGVDEKLVRAAFRQFSRRGLEYFNAEIGKRLRQDLN